MPLTKRQFRLGVDEETENWMGQIYHLLRADHDLAYSEKELLEKFEKLGVNLGWRGTINRSPKVGHALHKLVEMGVVEARDVDGDTYYAFQREVDENTW